MGKIFKQTFHPRRMMDGTRWEMRSERAAGWLMGLAARETSVFIPKEVEPRSVSSRDGMSSEL